jgi:hypothetical protein
MDSQDGSGYVQSVNHMQASLFIPYQYFDGQTPKIPQGTDLVFQDFLRWRDFANPVSHRSRTSPQPGKIENRRGYTWRQGKNFTFGVGPLIVDEG